VGAKASLYHLPLTICQQLGYFAAEGLEVEVADLAGSARTQQALTSGAADVACGPFEHTIALQAKGHFVESFVLHGRTPQICLGVSMKNLPNFRQLSDLAGRRIGVTAPGSATDMLVQRVLQRAGIAASEVSTIGVGNGAGALAALRSGQVDAICNLDPVMTQLEQRGEIRIVRETRTLKGTREIFGGNMPAGCLYAPLEFVQRHPATCQALANAMVHSLKWLLTAGPSDIIKTVPEAYFLGDRALYLAAFDKVRESICPDGLFAEDAARTALRALSSFEPSVKADKIALDKTFTNAFARRAKERFRA
jgi:NitT/TauT family transport system substrate-binding protein